MTATANQSHAKELSDNTFIEQFENQTLPPQHFDHLGHLRIAWLYLNRYSLEQAISRVCGGIKTYAESLGASTKFHFTITDAIVRIMAVRMKPHQDRSAFLAANADLVDSAVTVLHQYYSKELLFSEQARQRVMAPDLKAIG